MNNYVLTRIEAIQQELACLHQILVRQAKGEKATVELEGIWQGVEFNDSDFDLAKQSVFRDVYHPYISSVTTLLPNQFQ